PELRGAGRGRHRRLTRVDARNDNARRGRRARRTRTLGRPKAPGADARVPAVDTVWTRLRLRLLPALLTAIGVALLANGLLSYTSGVEQAPTPVNLALDPA